MADEEQPDHPVFKQATVKELLRLSHEPNTRISAAATHLSAEYLRLFATEAIHRAAEVAEKEREASKEAGKAGPPGMLETKHLEQILAGLLLDFS
ncbi:hypothetical protein RHOSPDRAFT_33638 [Rhodotorula sp. JG-1b]|uniref:Centromere protein X n=1 Tax=Rhodotorula mucilaginosa TaxID=5537 RepID=A0A9P7B4L0_RHOMI|nr:hypothetical protein C6P46_005177 [Rhodotorula mucilaginosa]KWU44818.1 hypothetical protein RHOSPDRAFT_33638 [Rhodotorula sp. JG-1b]TKA55914.1 hypothetical protein B0A53_01611 [Rhodotorula sp. CCFEE 5036]